MKILSVATSIPYPPDHGTRIRTWHFLTRLTSLAEVTLLTWYEEGHENPEHLRVLSNALNKVVAIPIRPRELTLRSRIRYRILSALRDIPPYMVETLERQPVPRLADEFDIAIAEDDGAMMLMPEISCPKIVHRHNVFSETIAGLLRSRSLGMSRTMKWRFELDLWKRFDVKLSERAILSTVTTPQAATALHDLSPHLRIEVIENGAIVPDRQLIPGSAPIAVFVGTMNYEPNADAAVRFARHVWPKVREVVPDARLQIIGRHPLAAVRRLNVPGVSVLGEVPDVMEACNGARVAVVPLYAGSGIKNKTLEMMALGLPVITSPIGAEGISDDAKGIIVADSDQSFVESARTLLTDSGLATKMGELGREYVRRRYSWEAATERYISLLKEVSEG